MSSPQPPTTPKPRGGSGRPPGTLRIGSIAGVDVLVRSSWLILAVLIAVIMAPAVDSVRPGLGTLKYLAGMAFAVLLYFSVLLHEVSHAVMARRFGIEVESIQLDFLGGVTQITSPARTAGQEFSIAIVGPLTSILVGFLALLGAMVTPDGLLLLTMQGLAGANLIVGCLNLVPGLPLDGGRVLKALIWGISKNPNLATTVAAWGGRMAAGLVFLGPLIARGLGLPIGLFDVFLAAVIGAFLWSGASATLRDLRIRSRLPRLRARDLARSSVFLLEDISVAEGVKRAQQAQASAIVVINRQGQPTGIVNEHAVAAMPEDRRPWVSIRSVAGSVDPGLWISADLFGEELIRVISAAPASDYILMEQDGTCAGVLSVSDVDRAFSLMMKGKG